MYGIVTNGIEWYFLRWAGSLEDAIIEFSGPYTCDFYDNLKNAEHIAVLLAISSLFSNHKFVV